MKTLKKFCQIGKQWVQMLISTGSSKQNEEVTVQQKKLEVGDKIISVSSTTDDMIIGVITDFKYMSIFSQYVPFIMDGNDEVVGYLHNVVYSDEVYQVLLPLSVGERIQYIESINS